MRSTVESRVPRVRARYLACAVLLLFADSLVAQEPFPVRGRVVDGQGRPVGGATIEVIGGYRSTQSEPDGDFEIHVPSSLVHVRIAKIGYEPRVILGSGRSSGDTPLLVRLERVPVTLQGINVQAPRTPALAQTVTATTVRQVPPLGEPDVFRAIVLLPGVSQPNDLKGRIHLAGGASDETGVHLDGHPLQDPFHLLGLFGAFNVAALERADVLIHHLPPSMGGRLSGIINLETRQPGEESEYEAVVSLLTTGLTVSGPVTGGFDLLASGRTTYLDRVVGRLSEDAPQLGFREGLVRVGYSWGDGWRAEGLTFTTRDHFREPELAGWQGYDPLTWGESLIGLRVGRAGMAWDFSIRASANRATVHLDERGVGSGPFPRTNFIDSQRDWSSGAVEVTRTAARWQMDLGASFDRRRSRHAWVARGLVDEVFSPNTPAEHTGEQTQMLPAVFGGGSLRIGERWTVDMGGRLWGGNGMHAAPRAHLEFRASDALQLEAALDRRYQWDAQLEEPIEGSVAAPMFFIDEPRVADVAALSARFRPVDLPFGSVGTFQVQAFRKEYRNRTLLRPSERGFTREQAEPAFPVFDRVPGYSTGAMMSGRFAFGNESLLQGSYTYQRVRERVEGTVSPTAWDVPHTLSLFGSVPLGGRWTLNAVYQGHSGRATTPVLARIFAPAPDNLNTLEARYLRGTRNSIRVPPYHRLDLGVRRVWQIGPVDVALALQVLNLLSRENAVDYEWQQHFGAIAGSGERRAGRSGLPILPSIGLEAKW